MTAPIPTNQDADKLVPMNSEEIAKFFKEYQEWVGASVRNEIAGHLFEIESLKKKIAAFREDWKEAESSVLLPEIRNRHKARIDQSIMIEEEEIRRVAERIKKIGKYRRDFTSLKFLKPMLLGLLEKDFYHFGFKTFATGEIALAGWTSFVEIESRRYNFAVQGAESKVFLLGHYRIEIALTQKNFQLPIKIYNLNNLASTTFPHPHINESFDPCFGDFLFPIQKCIEEKRFLHACHIIRLFLSSYSLNLPPGVNCFDRRPYARALIEFWPEKGSDAPPKKLPREGTGFYEG